MKKSNEPKLYSTKTKIIFAICVLLVIALTVFCLIMIRNGMNSSDAADTEKTETESDFSFKPVDTSVVTEAADESGVVTDAVTETVSETENIADDTSQDATDTSEGSGSTVPVQPGNKAETASSSGTESEDAGAPSNGFSLGEGLYLVSLNLYSGPFVEDGSDEEVEGVLAAKIRNLGDETVQYVSVNVETEEGTAVFEGTTILPGTSVTMLEKNRMKYTGKTYSGASINKVIRFVEEPSFCSDKIEVSGSDGQIMVKNISDEDITGKVAVYYKSVTEYGYFGGITYSATINGGISAGDSVIVSARHFMINDSRLMFVKYE